MTGPGTGGGDTSEDSAGGSRGPPTAGGTVYAARLRCDNCGRVTIHRIVHWDARGRASGTHRSGLARCRECSGTHPFEVRTVAPKEFDLIESRGPLSTRRRIGLSADERIAIGQEIPGVQPSLTVRRIVRTSGDSVPESRVAEIATVWAVPAEELGVRVSIVEGGRTRSARWIVPPGEVIAIGDRAAVEGVAFEVVALRAQGRTWRYPNVQFPAREVQRVYARRTVSPPAGRSDWRSGRGTPSSRTSSTSRSERYRSSPGVRRNRTSPRRRTASAGAAVQRISPS